MKSRKTIAFIGVCIILLACQKDAEISPTKELDFFPMPAGFPAISYPQDNQYSPERWALGKKLFFDNILSIDSSKSCASCHKPALAFSDDLALSDGVKNRPGKRNAPSLTNVAYLPYYTREGGVPTLEMQILVPIQEHNEFDFNIVQAGERLMQDSVYVSMSLKAYGKMPDYYVITRALANFERSLISGNSPYDQYVFQNNANALNTSEKEGMKLFYSEKTHCSDCHSGFNFTNNSFENNGLYKVYTDPGRKRLTNESKDEALFKVPTLRNVLVTAPYMHDGSLKTLREVVEHYDKGGEMHNNQSELIKPLGLSDLEKENLLAFLNSLTDKNFITNNFYKK